MDPISGKRHPSGTFASIVRCFVAALALMFLWGRCPLILSVKPTPYWTRQFGGFQEGQTEEPAFMPGCIAAFSSVMAAHFGSIPTSNYICVLL